MGNRPGLPRALPLSAAFAAVLLGACEKPPVTPAEAATPAVDLVPVQEQRLSAEQQDQLLKAVSRCVQLVRTSAPSRVRYEWERDFWTKFDAYYDPVSGRVVDNGDTRGHVPVVFAFRKCMVDHNWSLAY